MDVRDMTARCLSQMWPMVDRATKTLSQAELDRMPGAESNPIGWTFYHMGRVEDRWFHLLDGNSQQTWEKGWAQRLGMDPDPSLSGSQMTPQEIAAKFKSPPAEQLKGYADAVHAEAMAFLQRMPLETLGEEIEAFGGRKMTRGHILAHVVNEMNQHGGQIAYIKGLLKGYQGRVV